MNRIAFVTCDRFPQLTPDDALAKAALAERGAEVVAALWTDPGVPWNDFAAVIFRSTWDYYLRPVEFAHFLDSLEPIAPRVFNPLPLLRWNSDKRYLDDLAGRGVPVLPTRRLQRGLSRTLGQLLAEEGWDEAVLKPAISAGAFRTVRVKLAEAATHEALLGEILAAGDALLQRFQPEVVTAGEVSLIFLGGAFSHAALKRPAPGDFRTQPQYGALRTAYTPGPQLLQQATRMLDAAPAKSLYARVDGLVCEGTFRLMELELIEPDLYLSFGAGAPGRFAEAILQRIQ